MNEEQHTIIQEATQTSQGRLIIGEEVLRGALSHLQMFNVIIGVPAAATSSSFMDDCCSMRRVYAPTSYDGYFIDLLLQRFVKTLDELRSERPFTHVGFDMFNDSSSIEWGYHIYTYFAVPGTTTRKRA